MQGTGFFCKDASVGSSPTFSTTVEDTAGQPMSPMGGRVQGNDQRGPSSLSLYRKPLGQGRCDALTLVKIRTGHHAWCHSQVLTSLRQILTLRSATCLDTRPFLGPMVYGLPHLPVEQKKRVRVPLGPRNWRVIDGSWRHHVVGVRRVYVQARFA